MSKPTYPTLVRDAIYNPSERRHFMRVVPAGATYRIETPNGNVLAQSSDALICKEVGRDIYDPVVYFNRADVAMDQLAKTERTTHCPLKGDTEYFDLSADEPMEGIAWSYISTIPDAAVLKDLVAFDASQVRIVRE